MSNPVIDLDGIAGSLRGYPVYGSRARLSFYVSDSLKDEDGDHRDDVYRINCGHCQAAFLGSPQQGDPDICPLCGERL